MYVFLVIIILAHVCLSFVEKHTMLGGYIVNGMIVVSIIAVIVYALTLFKPRRGLVAK